MAQARDFYEKAVQKVVSNIDELRKALPMQVQKCLAFFPGVDRSVGGYEGLMAAQECIPNNEVRDKFAAEYSVLGTIWRRWCWMRMCWRRSSRMRSPRRRQGSWRSS